MAGAFCLSSQTCLLAAVLRGSPFSLPLSGGEWEERGAFAQGRVLLELSGGSLAVLIKRRDLNERAQPRSGAGEPSSVHRRSPAVLLRRDVSLQTPGAPLASQELLESSQGPPVPSPLRGVCREFSV